MTGDSRGQAFTLEGVISALLILMAVVLGLQAVDVAPFSDEQAEREAESLRTQVDDALAAVADQNGLRSAITCVNTAGDPDRAVGSPDLTVTALGSVLNQTLARNGNQYVLSVEYRGVDDSGNAVLERERLYPATVSDPPESAVASSRQVLLQSGDPVYRTQGLECVEDPGGQTLNETSQFYIDRHPDMTNTTNVYNAVRVRVVAW